MTGRACSLYRQWVLVSAESGVRLQAIWIDREMREFERQFEAAAGLEPLPENAVDEPGGPSRGRFELANRFVGEMVN
jgi:hypothetical protein